MNLDHVIPWVPAAPLRCDWLLWETPCILHLMHYIPASHVFAHLYRQCTVMCIPQTQRHTCWSFQETLVICMHVELHSCRLTMISCSFSESSNFKTFFFFFLIRLQSNDRQSKPFLTEILIRQVGDGNRTEGNGHTVAADSLWWDVGPFFSALLSVCFLSQCFSKKTNPDICHSDLFHKAHWWIHILRKNKKHWMPQPPYQFVFNLRKIPVVRYCL